MSQNQLPLPGQPHIARDGETLMVEQMSLEALAREAINVRMVSTSEIKISVLVDETALEKGVRTLHAAFGLAA